MFDLSWSEMLVVLVVAVVVIGPKDLPRVLYVVGKFIRKIRILTGDIQASLDKIIHEEELNEITREANRPGGENLQFEIEKQLALEEERRRVAEGGETPENIVKLPKKKDGPRD